MVQCKVNVICKSSRYTGSVKEFLIRGYYDGKAFYFRIKFTHTYINKRRDGSVGIALGYGLDDRCSRVRFPAGMGIFLFTAASRTALEPTQPPIQWVPRALSLEVKRPAREADHSPPFSANEWSYTSTPPIRLHGVALS
jgi:hypothetical protein